MPKRRWTRAAGLLAVLASAATFSSVSAPQAPEYRRGAAEGASAEIPEGFHVMELRDLDEVKRRRAARIRTDVEIANEVRRSELNRIQERAGRRPSLWSTF